MKTVFIALNIAAAALIAPVAVSFASTAPKAPVAAKPAPVLTQQVQASAIPAPVIVEAAPTRCTPKVRVVYSGYVQPAPARC